MQDALFYHLLHIVQVISSVELKFYFVKVTVSVTALKGINPFPNKPWILQLKYFENTVGKG